MIPRDNFLHCLALVFLEMSIGSCSYVTLQCVTYSNALVHFGGFFLHNSMLCLVCVVYCILIKKTFHKVRRCSRGLGVFTIGNYCKEWSHKAWDLRRAECSPSSSIRNVEVTLTLYSFIVLTDKICLSTFN